MSDLNASLAVLFQHEGGYSNKPADRGGPTKFGVTQKTLDAFQAKYRRDTYPVEQLTEQAAGILYRYQYWNPLELDAVGDKRVATVLLDLSVLHGVVGIIGYIQTVCSIPVDGRMGPETALAIQQQSVKTPVDFCLKVIFLMQRMFGQDVYKDPSQAEFLDGWLRRTQDLIQIAVASP